MEKFNIYKGIIGRRAEAPPHPLPLHEYKSNDKINRPT